MCATDDEIIILTETWLTDGVLSTELFSHLFNVFRCDRTYAKGGGVLIAIKNTHIVKKIQMTSPVSQIDVVGVKIRVENRQ